MASGLAQTWPINTDCKVTLTGLKDDAGLPIPGATITAVLNDHVGNPVAGAGPTDNLAFTPISGGDYYMYLSHTITALLVDGQSYTLVIKAVSVTRQLNANISRAAAMINL